MQFIKIKDFFYVFSCDCELVFHETMCKHISSCDKCCLNKSQQKLTTYMFNRPGMNDYFNTALQNSVDVKNGKNLFLSQEKELV